MGKLSNEDRIKREKRDKKLHKLVTDYQQTNDQDAFEKLYNYYLPKVKAIANKSGNEDIISIFHEDIINAVDTWTPDGGASFNWYFWMIHRRHIGRFLKNERKYEQRYVPVDNLPNESEEAPPENINIDNKIDSDLLIKYVLEHLPTDEHRMICTLIMEGKYTYEQIGQMLPKPRTSVTIYNRIKEMRSNPALIDLLMIYQNKWEDDD